MLAARGGCTAPHAGQNASSAAIGVRHDQQEPLGSDTVSHFLPQYSV